MKVGIFKFRNVFLNSRNASDAFCLPSVSALEAQTGPKRSPADMDQLYHGIISDGKLYDIRLVKIYIVARVVFVYTFSSYDKKLLRFLTANS